MFADLAYSARSFVRAPALLSTLLLTIALGIGSNAAVLGFIRGLATRDLPLADAHRLVALFARGEQDTFTPVSFDDYATLRRHDAVFDALGAAREAPETMEIAGARTIVSAAASTPDIAEIFQLPLDDGIVVSQPFAESTLAATKTPHPRVRIAGRDLPVHGGTPAWLTGIFAGRPVDVWRPLDESAMSAGERRSRTFWILGRLRQGVSIRAAQAAIDSGGSTGSAIAVLPYSGETPEVASRLARVERLLIVAATVVFLVACANVAVFLLSRASGRSQETSVRVALGAGRRRLGRQLLADSLLIAAAGTTAGFVLAMWTVDLIPWFFYAEDAAALVYSTDSAAIVVASLACAAIVVLAALVPLFEIRADRPADVLRREGRGPSNAMRRLRAGLVVGQMTCCCLLVISTGLLIEGFRTSLRTSRGDRASRPLIATVQAIGLFDRPDLGQRYFRELEQAALKVPDVTRAAWVGTLPGSRPAWIGVRIEPPRQPVRPIAMAATALTPSTLDTLEPQPVAGRMFGGGDTPSSCPAVVVNQVTAERYFDGDALGRVVEDPEGRRLQIVGVVRPRALITRPPSAPMAYYYAEQMPPPLPRDGGLTFTTTAPAGAPAIAMIDAIVVSPGYFDLMGFSGVAGDLLSHSGPCRAGVLNVEAAERYFAGNAVGGAVIDDAGVRTEIVGVVQSPLLRASQRRVEPAIYLPLRQNFLPRMTMIAIAGERPNELVAPLAEQLSAVKGGTVVAATTLDRHLSQTALAPDRIATFLVGAAAAIALIIGVLGMYGAMADAARQRRREIALRIALGANWRRIVGQVLGEGLRLSALGAAAGLVGSLAVAAWMARTAPDASAPTVWVWLAAPAVLLAVTVVASVIPARRALAIDPLTIMRD